MEKINVVTTMLSVWGGKDLSYVIISAPSLKAP